MAEVQFVNAFLASLDRYPIKLPADYAEDPRSYPARAAYPLPRMPRPMKKPTAVDGNSSGSGATLVPGQARNVTVLTKSLHRSPPLDVKMASPDHTFTLDTTSLLDVRMALAETTHVPLEKLRLLYNKKPVVDGKLLKDLVAAAPGEIEPTEIELGVMVTGGAATVAAAAAAAATAVKAAAAVTAATEPAAVTPPTAEAAEPDAIAAESEGFWTDLRKFLVKRTGSEKQADELFSLFLRSWEDRMA
ncbi:hypothetical protein SEPCBS119000_001274 [Sporothrix epigloea]|uniref:Ubiquitin-like domain-containing protein n=1 Tax=Sporothrix epigloea TaxID=1892477 RepID=A0ABP0D9S9_9PEZI